MDELTVGSLFSGVGGFDLGFERAGMRTVWFCEQDDYCRRVLARHWPGVPCHPDVCALVADTDPPGRGGVAQRNGAKVHGPPICQGGDADGRADLDGGYGDAREGPGAGLDGALPVPVPYVDVLCGGFPCQDISLAGKGAGIGGARSGLWGEFARLIGELRPRYVVVENVPAITSRGLDVVLGDLAACGFDAEWDHLPAAAFGAPHRRDRFWLVAYPNGEGSQGHGRPVEGAREVAVAEAVAADGAGAVGDTSGLGRDAASDPRPSEHQGRERSRPLGGSGGDRGGPARWELEPGVGRVAHGIPHRVDRLRALGNSLVPQVAEWIGRRIVEWEQE